MYNEELENLIDAALADGELTEKEKQILFKKAQSYGIDLDEFEMVLDSRLVKLKNAEKTEPAAPKSNKLGDVKKCPSCGAMVGAFKTVCPECDYEFRDVDANRSITELTNRINAIYEECDRKERAGDYKIKGLERVRDTRSETERKEEDIVKRLNNVIANFPVPNTREDIIELLQFIQPKVQAGYSTDKNAAAWRHKYVEIINRAKTSYRNDSKMMSEIALYEQASKQSAMSSLFTKYNALSQQAKMLVIGIPLFIVMMVIIALLAAFEDDSKEAKSTEIDNVSESTMGTENTVDGTLSDIKNAFSDIKEDSDTEDAEDYEEESEDNISTETTTNWDKVLDDYESLVNSYLLVAEKAKNGDASAVAEYPNILEKAQSMSSQLGDAKEEMTFKQVARYTKINAKITKATLTM